MQTDGTKGTRRLADKKMDTRTGAQNGYTDWQKLAATKRKKNKKRISRLAANRFADLAATGYWGIHVNGGFTYRLTSVYILIGREGERERERESNVLLML